MPTLAELKIGLEEALKDPPLKAEIYARPLRAAELIRTGGRGSNAPQMSERDAANLLIAILGNAPAIRGPETVARYRSLPLLRRRPGPRGLRSTRPQKTRDLRNHPLKRIREIHFFGEVVELLILRAADGAIWDLARKWPGGPANPGLSLKLMGPGPEAVLRIPMLQENLVLNYADESQATPTPSEGIVRATEVYEDVVLAIGRLFQGE